LSLSFLKKNTCKPEEKKLFLKGDEHGLMKPILPASETSTQAPVDNFFMDNSSTISLVN
jgi:hypothetical protein